MTQDQLNTDIAQELNKWQPIVEYGRLKIDEDNDIRSEYKWLIIFKNSVAGQLISTIIDFVLSQKVSYIFYYVLGVLVLCLSITLIVCLVNIKTIKKLMSKKNKDEIYGKLNDAQSYLNNLGRWLIETAPDNKHSKVALKDLESDYRVAKNNVTSLENRFSILYGKIDPILEDKAKDKADKNLQRYKKFI